MGEETCRKFLNNTRAEIEESFLIKLSIGKIRKGEEGPALYQVRVKMPEETWPVTVRQAAAREQKPAAESVECPTDFCSAKIKELLVKLKNSVNNVSS